MKTLITTMLLMTLSFTASARTYIQCNSVDFDDIRMVLNLTGNTGTMFITNGVHLPNEGRQVRRMTYSGNIENFKVFNTIENDTTNFELHVPHNAIETYNNNFDVYAFPMNDKANNERLVFSCFNNIFED